MIDHFGMAPMPMTGMLIGQRSLLMKSLEITTVFDIGANVGQYGSEIRRAGYKGALHSFEPGAEAFDALTKTAEGDAHWSTHRLAFSSSSGMRLLNTWGNDTTVASLREPEAGLVEWVGAPSSEKVEVETLESWLEAHPTAHTGGGLLKADVQGSEREVFLGAGEKLREFAVIEVEAPLSDWYKGQATMPDLVTLLLERGFVPVSVMTERFMADWSRAVDVDILAVRDDLVRVPR